MVIAIVLQSHVLVVLDIHDYTSRGLKKIIGPKVVFKQTWLIRYIYYWNSAPIPCISCLHPWVYFTGTCVYQPIFTIHFNICITTLVWIVKIPWSRQVPVVYLLPNLDFQPCDFWLYLMKVIQKCNYGNTKLVVCNFITLIVRP